jgi:predicted nucleic acid-binding protein
MSGSSFIDTQVVSYAMKGQWSDPIAGSSLSSVVANEFLLAYTSNLRDARYYIPISNRKSLLPRLHSLARREYKKNLHARRVITRQAADKIIMEFGAEYPTILEFNSISVAKVINERNKSLFRESIEFVNRRDRQIIMQRFDFLLDSSVRCVPLSFRDVTLAFRLLNAFTRTTTVKLKFRNTWNDILVLATAKNRLGRLVTRDKILSRFAADVYGAEIRSVGSFLEVSFDSRKEGRQRSRESKGYVNRRWQVQFVRRGHGS